jgi:hypothetical protein
VDACRGGKNMRGCRWREWRWWMRKSKINRRRMLMWTTTMWKIMNMTMIMINEEYHQQQHINFGI